MQSFGRDLRYGFQLLLKNPGSTAIAVLALAVAIGANSAIFSVVNGVLLRPLPYADSEHLVIVWETQPTKNIREFSVTPPNFRDWSAQQKCFDRIAAYRAQPAMLTGNAQPERVDIARVTPTIFPALGTRFHLGRPFLPDEDRPGKNHEAVISYGLWQRRFAGEQTVLGKMLTMDGSDYQIVGVTEPDFRLLDTPSELWIPYTLDARELQAAGKSGARSALHILKVVAHLKPGVGVIQAQQEMHGIAAGLERQFADSNEGWGANVVGLQEQLVGDIRPTLITLLAAVTFVLFIACSNVASLLLARASARQKEFAIRGALGASQSRLLRQLLTEGMVLALVSGALGLLLAFLGVRALVAFSPGNIPRMAEIAVDGRVLAFTLLAAVLTGLLAGIAPAISASRARMLDVLKAAGRGTFGSRKSRMVRNFLIVLEVALSVVLLIGAGLMIHSFARLQSVNPGFRPDHVLTMKFTLPKARYDGLKIAQFHQRVLERVSALPGVQLAGLTRDLPLSGADPSLNFTVESRPVLSSSQQPRAKFRAVSADYFAAMGIPLVKGRYFTSADTESAPGVAVINDVMARKFFPGEDPIGKRIQTGFDDAPWSTIVAVIGGVHHGGLDAEANAEMYFPYRQIPPAMMGFVAGTMTLVVRTATDPASLARPIAEQIRSLDPDEAVFKVATLDDLLRNSTAQPRFRAYLLAIFAAIAIILAATGLYGVISYSVSQRTGEMGIRAALGAQKPDLLKLVLGEGIMLAVAGVAIGLVLAYLLSATISKLLYGVEAHDALVFVLVPAILLVVAVLASYVPALRATRIDPGVALRYD